MKHVVNTVLAITICSGLLIAGAETENLTTQLFASGGGVMLFAVGCLLNDQLEEQVGDTEDRIFELEKEVEA
jgi:4-hydroxybenzoate polyprenyltransferase